MCIMYYDAWWFKIIQSNELYFAASFKQDLLDDNFFYFMVSGLLSMFIVYHYEKIRKKHMINKKVGLKDTKVNSYKLGWIWKCLMDPEVFLIQYK